MTCLWTDSTKRAPLPLACFYTPDLRDLDAPYQRGLVWDDERQRAQRINFGGQPQANDHRARARRIVGGGYDRASAR